MRFDADFFSGYWLVFICFGFFALLGIVFLLRRWFYQKGLPPKDRLARYTGGTFAILDIPDLNCLFDLSQCDVRVDDNLEIVICGRNTPKTKQQFLFLEVMVFSHLNGDSVPENETIRWWLEWRRPTGRLIYFVARVTGTQGKSNVFGVYDLTSPDPDKGVLVLEPLYKAQPSKKR